MNRLILKFVIAFLPVVLIFSSFIEKAKTTGAGAINTEQLHTRIIKPDNDTLFVVNFFATWCRPCIEEMPYFVKASETFAGQKIKLLFVSLDGLKEQVKVEAFAVRKNLPGEVYILDSGDPNVWINQIDNSWTGSMPATMFYKKGQKKLFHEGEFTQSTLDSTINLYK